MLEKRNGGDRLEIDLRTGLICVETLYIIVEDGEEISRQFYRQTLTPGDDDKVAELGLDYITKVVWTDDVRARTIPSLVSEDGN